jgi:hypothetical protein
MTTGDAPAAKPIDGTTSDVGFRPTAASRCSTQPRRSAPPALAALARLLGRYAAIEASHGSSTREAEKSGKGKTW